jgi:penicillin-binding protein 1A
MPRLTGRLVRSFGIVALFLGAALAGTASGVVFAFVGDLPQISALDDYSPKTITRVLGRDGSVIGEFATEHRELVTYDQIPPVLRNAIISAEDADFFHHGGINLERIAITAIKRAVGLQQYGGASTLTQQLARKLFLTDEQTLERKIKEALLALQIEKRYTKQEIFTMYCNKMYWGHGAYGVEAASELYFDKHVGDLTLDEAAMIAGIIQGNVRQSPYVNMKAAVRRRNYTLDRMADNGYISAAQAAAAKKRPIIVRGQPTPAPSIAPYFLETVRQQLEDRYGSKALYESGLTVRTGLDPALQRSANAALNEGVRRLDKRRGYRKPTRNLVDEGKSPDTAKLAQWVRNPAPGDFMPAVVTAVDGSVIHVRILGWAGAIVRSGYAWTHRTAHQVARRGDIVEVKVTKVDQTGGTFAADMDQTPLVQGAVLALDNHTGNVLAMVGGDNFDQSQFNRATQALRQVGSLFKPFVYMAAIDRGYTVSSILDDTPASFVVGPGQPLYEPRNYDMQFLGDVSLRLALEESRNVPTIRLMAALGPENVIQYARNLGITSPLPPYLSVAIGSAEATLLEMTSAYSALPDQGVRMTPRLVLDVTDHEGNVLEQTRPQAHEALRADTAYIITNLLQGVIQSPHGTAHSAAAINWPLGGKTGTTDDFTDAWFIGFDPDITIGVWVGYDQKKSLGDRMEGSAAALPIWRNIMQAWAARRRKELAQPPAFERPGNIVIVATGDGPDVYIAGTEPGRQ